MIVLGIDPGFANCGWAIVELKPESERLVALGCIQTKKANKKRKMLATDDNMRRTRQIAEELAGLLASCEATGTPVKAIATEAQSWPRSSSVSAKLGMAWGVVGTLVELRGLALLQASPQQIKESIVDDRSASKEAVREALGKRKGFETLEDKLSAITSKARQAHPVDAAAAVITCCDAPALQIGRKM